MTDDSKSVLNRKQLEQLVSYFDEKVEFSKHIKARIEDAEPGRAILYIDTGEIHLNGNGSLHGGVYTTLIDNAMGLSVVSLVNSRTATTQMIRAFPGIRQRGTDHVLWRGRAPNSQDGDRRRQGLRRTGRPGCDGYGIVQDLREAGQPDRVIEMYRVSCRREKGVREGGYRTKRADERFRLVSPRW